MQLLEALGHSYMCRVPLLLCLRLQVSRRGDTGLQSRAAPTSNSIVISALCTNATVPLSNWADDFLNNLALVSVRLPVNNSLTGICERDYLQSSAFHQMYEVWANLWLKSHQHCQWSQCFSSRTSFRSHIRHCFFLCRSQIYISGSHCNYDAKKIQEPSLLTATWSLSIIPVCNSPCLEFSPQFLSTNALPNRDIPLYISPHWKIYNHDLRGSESLLFSSQ